MGTFKVLVCDDEPHIVHVVSAKLKNNGFEVVTAGDGEEAFAAAKAESPDLVITDYQMPYLSGLELCARLRNDAETSQIPVIMLTARGFSLGDDDTKDTNIRKVLPKPFSPREVLACVHEILGEPATTTSSQ
ncbi:MAG: response regulator [Phycisphaerales bacterium]|nr:response regulator [Planctomycetales bacterium]MCA9253981.1 response regulator [Phycisphaerales bacterium]